MKKACFLFFVLLFYLPIDEVEFLRNRLPISEYKLSKYVLYIYNLNKVARSVFDWNVS